MYISDLTYLEVANEISEVNGAGYKGHNKYGYTTKIEVDQYASVKVDDIYVKSYKSGGFSLNISASNNISDVDL